MYLIKEGLTFHMDLENVWVGPPPPRDPTPLDDLASRGSANVGFTASWHQDKNRTKVMVKIYWLKFMIIGSSGTSL